MRDNAAIIADSLVKTYRSGVRALDGLSLSVRPGTVVGLLGLNGAGKSTLINTLAGIVRPDEGQAMVGGFDVVAQPVQARRAIGIVHQEIVTDPFFTPVETLRFQAGLYGVPASARLAEQLLQEVGLEDVGNVLVRKLSGGMKRRLMIAKALVHRPPTLILDEPTAGVDPQLRAAIWRLIRALRDHGRTVVLSTHYLEEAQELCDDVHIIHAGRIIAGGGVDFILARAASRSLRVRAAAPVPLVPPHYGVMRVERLSAHELRISFDPRMVTVGELLALLASLSVEIVELVSRSATLEDVFLQLTRPPNAIESAADSPAAVAALSAPA